MFDQTSATTLMDHAPTVDISCPAEHQPNLRSKGSVLVLVCAPNRPKLILDAVPGELPPERRALFQTLAAAIGQVVGHQTIFRMRWSIP